MLNTSFYINEKYAGRYDIILQKPVHISGLEPIVKKVHIPGRNGDLILETGAYKNRKAKAVCYILNRFPRSTNLSDRVKAATDFILQSGYYRLRVAEDFDHFFMARVTKGPSMDPRCWVINPTTIEWDCKPQRFRNDGEETITYTEAGSRVISNPGSGISLPIFKIYGNGSAGIRVGSNTVYVRNIKDEITIDCDAQDAYSGNPAVNRNSDIVLRDGKFPCFLPGENNVIISGSNVTKIEIIPRWWDK